MSSILKFTGAALLGSMMLAAPAFATTVNGTCGSVSGPTELGGATPGGFTCTKFDSDLGPLTSMVLTVSGQIVSSITLTNNNQTSQSGSAATISSFYLGALTGFTFGSPLFTLNASTGPVTLAGLASGTYAPLIASSNSGSLSPNTFVPYEASGGGVFNLLVSTDTGLFTNFGGGNVGATQVTSAGASATVVYTYGVTTPEPASMALLGAGLVGMGLARRRKRG